MVERKHVADARTAARISPRMLPRIVREQDAQARIDEQVMLIARLHPGSEAHRTATEVLLLFRDALHALNEAHELLARLEGG